VGGTWAREQRAWETCTRTEVGEGFLRRREEADDEDREAPRPRAPSAQPPQPTHRPALLHEAVVEVVSRGGPRPVPTLLLHGGDVDVKGCALKAETQLVRGREILVLEVLGVGADG
jgi:hypothetical protein